MKRDLVRKNFRQSTGRYPTRNELRRIRRYSEGKDLIEYMFPELITNPQRRSTFSIFLEAPEYPFGTDHRERASSQVSVLDHLIQALPDYRFERSAYPEMSDAQYDTMLSEIAHDKTKVHYKFLLVEKHQQPVAARKFNPLA